MWQRFTERSRHVILLGQEEAARMSSGYVGTEHLLLGLLTESECVAAQILHKMDVTADFVRVAIEARTTAQDRRGVEPRLTPKAKRVLELAADEARRMRHNYIGTEHLLLALLRERDGLAAEILLEVGLNLADMREQVMNYLGTGVADEPVRKPGWHTLKSKTQMDVSPGFHTLLSLAANRAHAAGSDTVNLLHFLQVLLEPENKAEMSLLLLKEGGQDVEKALMELAKGLQSGKTDHDAADEAQDS